LNADNNHHDHDIELRVLRRREVAKDLIELEFESSSSEPLGTWTAGSHISLRLGNGLSRQYSLMRGIESKSNWRIGVLVETGGRGGSLFIKENLFEGSIVKSSAPQNHFELENSKTYSFIAGGVGITPILEMIAVAEANGAAWVLHYLGRSKESMAYYDELCAEFPTNVKTFVADENRRFDVENFVEALEPESLTYVCGPEKLLVALEKSFGDNDSLRWERFHPKEESSTKVNFSFEVHCAISNIDLVVDADESIFMAADAAGIELEGDCLEGTCGSCETRVISGEIDHRDSVRSWQANEEHCSMMICVSRSLNGPITLEL